MGREDIRRWLDRNKKFVSVIAIEKEVGVPNAYIKFFVLGDRKYPTYSERGKYIPYDQLIEKIAKAIISIGTS